MGIVKKLNQEFIGRKQRPEAKQPASAFPLVRATMNPTSANIERIPDPRLRKAMEAVARIRLNQKKLWKERGESDKRTVLNFENFYIMI
jgi:hypothetical protein